MNNLAATPLQGTSIINAFKESHINTVVALPDIVTCDSVLWPIADDPEFKVVPVCKEDEGVSICAGLSYCLKRAVLLIQHTGFLDSINSIRAIAVDYSLPVIMFVGLQGMEVNLHPNHSSQTGIRILEPMCNLMGLESHLLTWEEDLENVPSTIDLAYQESKPIVFFITQAPDKETRR